MTISGNTAIGFEALISNTTGVSNVAVGRHALRFNTAGGNTALGTETLYTNTSGDNNTASGYRALYFNTTGGFNTAHGSSALVANTTGSENTAMGHSAMASNTTGIANTAVGLNALFGNTTGTANTASGHKALRVNSTGYFNTAAGTRALEANSAGFENTASGVEALQLNTTGNSNTASGRSALAANTTGNFNTAVGSNALRNSTTASSNIALGSGAGNALTTGGGNIAIGHPGIAGESNIIRIGTAQTDTFLTGIIHGDGSALTGVPAASITGSIVSGQLAANLTLGGTTSGSFSGSGAGLSVPTANLTGTLTTAQITNGAVTSAKLGTGLSLSGGLLVAGDWNGEQGALGLSGHRPTIRFTGDADSGNESWLLHLGGNGPGNLQVLRRTGPAAYNTVMAFPTNGRNVEIYGGDALGLIGSQPFMTFFDTNAGNAASRIQAQGGDLFLESASYLAGQFDTGFVLKTGTGFVGIGTLAPVAKLHAETSLPNTAAVYGNATSGVGVYGQSTSGSGVYGTSASGDAGYFDGNVKVTGFTQSGGVNCATLLTAGLNVQGNANITGTLSKGGGSFKIDHPLDPANKTLSHSFVESPDMMNIYNGNVALDARGEAVVVLPKWFDALNKEFRYQLTCIGGFAPVYVAEEIAGNRFKIAGGRQGLKVSWQVTGVRRDAWANAHRIPVEEDKPAGERGSYLHPVEIGQPVEKSSEWARHPAAMRAMKTRPVLPARSAAPLATPAPTKEN